MHQDPKGACKVVHMVSPGDYVDTAPTGADVTSVDTKGWEWARIDFCAGVLTGGTNWTATLQQSSDNGSVDSFADVEASPTSKTKITHTASTDRTVLSIVVKCSAVERYLKLAMAKTGTWTVSELSVTCTLFGPRSDSEVGSESGAAYVG